MTGRSDRPGDGPRKALVRVRLSGDADTVTGLADRLAEHFEVLDVSAPYPNRRDPGVRRYLLINHSTQADEPGPDAA
jgi:hypothetical protein